ncbi:lysosomal-associated transmembrane protein 5-like [Lissotriton helveticus]
MRDGLEMATFRSREVPRCCGCLTVRSVSLGLALYIMFSSALILVMYTVDLAHGRDSTLADMVLAYLCGALLMLVALGMMCGVLKAIPSLLLPFLAFQTLDLSVSILSFCGLFVRFPPCLGFLNWGQRRAALFMDGDKYPAFPESSDMEPTEKQLLRPIIYLALSAAAVVLLKFYFLKCVWRCYKFLKAGRSEERQVHVSTVKLPEKGLLLPSYEEAVALPAKEPPPPAYTV